MTEYPHLNGYGKLSVITSIIRVLMHQTGMKTGVTIMQAVLQ